MTEPETPREDGLTECELRTHLSKLVDDVEPKQDALPALIAARRRRRVRRVATATSAAVVAATALLIALIVPPTSHRGETSMAMGVAPDSYVAQLRPGVLWSVAIDTGDPVRRIARVDAPARAMATDGRRSYAALDSGEVVRVGADGSVGEVYSAPTDQTIRALSAARGRLAVATGHAIEVISEQSRHRVEVSEAARIVDVALDGSGRLALVTHGPESGTAVRVVAPGKTEPAAPLRLSIAECAPVRVAWTGTGLAVLHGDCGATPTMRVATVDVDSGRLIGAGTPFDVGARRSGFDVRISTDSAERMLVSTGRRKQWLVTPAGVRRLPPACGPDGRCARVPAVM